jgi:hypothetical protein
MRAGFRLLGTIFILATLLGGCARASVSEQAAACQAVLTVDSTPRDAAVTIDGAPQGTTPLRLLLQPGAATVELAREGFAPVHRSVRLSCEQETALAIDLQDVLPPQVALEATASRSPSPPTTAPALPAWRCCWMARPWPRPPTPCCGTMSTPAS